MKKRNEERKESEKVRIKLREKKRNLWKWKKGEWANEKRGK